MQTCLNYLKRAISVALFADAPAQAETPAPQPAELAHCDRADLIEQYNMLAHARIPQTPTPKPGYAVVGDGDERKLEKIDPRLLEREKLLQPIAERVLRLYLELAKLSADWYAAFDEIEAMYTRNTKRIADGKRASFICALLDGSMKFQRSWADRITYDEPMLLEAKALIDECIERWEQEGTNKRFKKIADLAFEKNRVTGQYSRAGFIRLRKLEDEDPQWQEAMKIIVAAERVEKDAASYLLAYVVDDKGRQIPLPLNLCDVRPWQTPFAPGPAPIRPIRTVQDYRQMRADIVELEENDHHADSPEGLRLDVMRGLTELWERTHNDDD